MSRSRRRPAAKKQQADRAAARKFWGEIPTEEPPAVAQPDDPTAMVLSLGAPPLPAFERLAEVAADLRRDHPEATVVSAGMSGDLEEAIRCGATHVRVGSAVLGPRPSIK